MSTSSAEPPEHVAQELHPFSVMASCRHDDWEGYHILALACGSDIHMVSMPEKREWKGRLEYSWSSASCAERGNEEPPEKRRRMNVPKADVPASVILLKATPNGEHLVAATAEDKAIHVFEIDQDGHLVHLSRRCMPKRPSALAFGRFAEDVLIADKFGDVYSIPLLPDPKVEQAYREELQRQAEAAATYKPSATTLTVHSKRNLASLQQQLERAKTPVAAKEQLQFSHKLLLGHVSMVLDMLVTRFPEDGHFKSYIITADRDEHIRVSRGPPQAHIIENYCLAHESFVSKLCFATDEILVSGGGDDYLCVWDWEKGQLLKRIMFRDVKGLRDQDIRANVSRAHFGYSTGLRSRWLVNGMAEFPQGAKNPEHLLLTFEGVAALFWVKITEVVDPKIVPTFNYLLLDGNALDLCVSDLTIFVTMDNVNVEGKVGLRRRQDLMEDRIAVVEPNMTQPRPDNPDIIAVYGYDKVAWKDFTLNDRLNMIPCSSTRRYTPAERNEILYSLGRLKKEVPWPKPEASD